MNPGRPPLAGQCQSRLQVLGFPQVSRSLGLGARGGGGPWGPLCLPAPHQAHPSSLLLLPATSPPIPADALACRQQREGWGRPAQAHLGDLALGSSAV